MTMQETMGVLGLVTTILLATIGYLYKYFDDKRVRERQERLRLVNKRLEEFYGPLFFRVEAGQRAYETLLKKLGKSAVEDSPTEEDLVIWRMWYVNIFHPSNLEEEKIIIDKSYLIIEDKIPQCLIDFISHISVYKALIKRWDAGDYSENFSEIDFPVGLKQYIHDNHLKLKKEQAALIKK